MGRRHPHRQACAKHGLVSVVPASELRLSPPMEGATRKINQNTRRTRTLQASAACTLPSSFPILAHAPHQKVREDRTPSHGCN